MRELILIMILLFIAKYAFAAPGDRMFNELNYPVWASESSFVKSHEYDIISNSYGNSLVRHDSSLFRITTLTNNKLGLFNIEEDFSKNIKQSFRDEILVTHHMTLLNYQISQDVTLSFNLDLEAVYSASFVQNSRNSVFSMKFQF